MGFSFAERMTGNFHLLADVLVDHPLEIDIEVHVRVLRAPIATVVGRINADGLANGPIQGTLGLNAIHERRIPYSLFFTADDGRPMRLVGDKDLSWLAPLETLVVLPFTVIENHDAMRPPISIERDSGSAWTEIARGTARFDVRHDWRTFIRSVWASPF